MHPFVHKLFEILFPPSGDALIVQETSPTYFSKFSESHIYEDHTYLLPYADPIVRACIHEAKFYRNKKAITLLAEVLANHHSKLPHRSYIVVPVPLSKARYRERGHNQVTTIAVEAIRQIEQVNLDDTILLRTKNTRRQTELKKEAREANVVDAFGIHNDSAAASISSKHIILLDDVVTTGATLSAAKAALSPHAPASVTSLALAH